MKKPSNSLLLILLLTSFNANSSVVLECILDDGKHLVSYYKDKMLYLKIDKKVNIFDLNKVTHTKYFGYQKEYISVDFPDNSILFSDYDAVFSENYEFGFVTSKNKTRKCKKIIKSDFESIQNDSKKSPLS